MKNDPMYPLIRNGILKTAITVLMVAMVLISCKVTEKYTRPAGVSDNKLFRDIITRDTSTIADIPWMQMFADTLLQGLIKEGIDHNPDLKIAMDRMDQAQANLRQKKAAFFPTFEEHAGASVQKPPGASAALYQYQLYGSASWEIDLWGKMRSAKRATLAALLQSDAYRKAVQTQLVSEIATDYFVLLAYDAQMQVALKTVENRMLDVATMKQLKESNVVTGAAVVQSEANLLSIQVTIPDLKQNIRETENALSVLLGRSPGEIRRDSLDNQHFQTDLPTGIPAQLLANRPDVQEAEYQLRYYFELTNVAKTYFYPSLTITAEAGISSSTVSQFLSAASVFRNIAAGLVQPVLNQGVNKQRLKVAQAQQEESLDNFKKALLNAGEEVSNALYLYQTTSDKLKIRSQQIVYLQKAVEFTKELLKYTEHTNYTDVLTSDENLLAAQLNGVHDKLQQLQATVTLYRSLGGGWK